MKKVLKILGILLGMIVLLAAVFVIYNTIKTHKTLNDPRLPDDYDTSIKTGGALEAKYVGRGSYDVESIVVPSNHKSIKNIRIYYPAELKGTDRRYPLVMVVNGSQSPARTYLPYFERLASWGFIVVGTDDPQPGTGETASEALDYVLNESEIRDHIDTENMGAAGYSQGGAGAINAVTKFENSRLYKTLFTGSAAYPLLAKSMGWEYDPADIAVSYFMTAATGASDDQGLEDISSGFAGVAPLQSLVEIYQAMDENAVKIRARCVGAEHEEMQLRTDGYMTAWMLWQLQGDEEAASVFVGDDAEILANPNWQDVEKNQ